MINVSNEFERNLLNDNRKYKYFIDITLSNGKVINITNTNLWSGTFKIEDSVSQDNNLDVGDAIINKLSFSIDNIDNSYSEYDFTNASVVAYIALNVNEELEKLKKFTGIVDETTYNGSLISITAFDNMSKGDKDFDTSGIDFPVSIGELILYCATKMGIPLGTTKFPNMEFVVESLPNDSSSAITYRQVISWCAQICGCFARCNRNGELEIKWYHTEYLLEQFADGGTFDTTTTPYSDGDNVDGGTFNTTTTPYSDGASIDSGVFTSVEAPHYFTSYSSHNIGVDDVVVTGVSVKTKEQDSEPVITGSSGYVIAIENNPFVTEDNKQSIADFIGKRLIGVKFRTLTANVLSDPSVEAGDVGFFYGLNHNYYPILISSVTFSAGGYMSIRSSAKTPARNKAVTYSEETKNYVDLRKKIAIEKSMREIQEQKLNEALNSSSGLYTTIEKGSTGDIYYFHNHKDLSDSDIVWKMTAEAWGVSTDGGKTFNGGMTVDGDTITRILTATGINADWIVTGKIKDKNSTNYWNLDTGEFKLSPNTKIGDSTVSSKSYADNAVKSQTQTDIFNKLTNNGQTQGIYLDGEKLYINAEYIATGILRDKKGNFSLNMNDGTLKMSDGVFKGEIDSEGDKYITEIRDGEIIGRKINSEWYKPQIMSISYSTSHTVDFGDTDTGVVTADDATVITADGIMLDSKTLTTIISDGPTLISSNGAIKIYSGRSLKIECSSMTISPSSVLTIKSSGYPLYYFAFDGDLVVYERYNTKYEGYKYNRYTPVTTLSNSSDFSNYRLICGLVCNKSPD